MTRYGIENEYFDWMYDMVCERRFYGDNSYWDLLNRLHNTPFRYILSMDENRASNGIELRWRFAVRCGFSDVPDELRGPCSVLEMLIALAMDCEDWMDDASYGDRTSQWFWGMITNLGLGAMTDDRFDPLRLTGAVEVNHTVHNAVVRDGAGILPHLLHDFRKVLDAAGAVQQTELRMYM